jgi:hypothetical protein
MEPETLNFNRLREKLRDAEIAEMTYFLDIVETLITRGECGFSSMEMSLSTFYKIRELVERELT